VDVPQSLLLVTAIGLVISLIAGWRSRRTSRDIRSGRKRYKRD